MTDKPDLPSDVAAALIHNLETGAELVDVGAFTVDLASARDKLAEYRLANPEAFVLLLVEAAHLLSGCSEIEFSISASETRVRLANANLSGHELRSVFDTAIGALTPHELGRQRLALAIDTALSQPGTRVRLRANSTDQRDITVDFEAAGQTVHDEAAIDDIATPPLLLVFDGPRDDGGEEQRDLLEARARYAKLPVIVNGTRVDDPTPLKDVAEPVEITTATGTRVGQAGWSSAREEPRAILVAHGVIVEELREPSWQPSFVALVDVEDLRRDLSLAKLVRDGAFDARVADIHAGYDALPFNPPTEVAYATLHSTKPIHLFTGLAFLALFLIFLRIFFRDDLWTENFAWIAIVVIALPVIGSGWAFIDMHLDDRARDRGLRAIGVIESVRTEDRPKNMKALTLAIRVSVPDRAPFSVSLECIVGDREHQRFRVGARFHMRVDRDADRRVWLDVPPR